MPKFQTSLAKTREALGEETADPAFDTDAFVRLPKAKGGDWLLGHKETGQTFPAYVRRVKPGGMSQAPKPGWNGILLIPIGKSFDCPIGREMLPLLFDYACAFYHPLPVKLHPAPLSLKGIERRQNENGQKQYKLGPIFEMINKSTIRGNHEIYCRLGITLEDIYPNDDFNFVYGQARLIDKVGVFSFSRHSPHFYGNGVHLKEASLTKKQTSDFFSMACRTMVHEIGHMFGMLHCIYYQCLMNGSNGSDESAAKSGLCCPVCLRKILHALSLGSGKRIGAAERYQAMASALGNAVDSIGVSNGKLVQSKIWLEQRMSFLDGGKLCGLAIDNEGEVEVEEEEEDEEGKDDESGFEGEYNKAMPIITDIFELSMFVKNLPFTTTVVPSREFNTSLTRHVILANFDPSYNFQHRDIGTRTSPNLRNFIFDIDSISSGAHFDWWVVPTGHRGGSLCDIDSNVFMVRDKEEREDLFGTTILIHGRETHYLACVLLAISNIMKSTIPIKGARLEKFHTFIDNILDSKSAPASMKSQAARIASLLPQVRLVPNLL